MMYDRNADAPVQGTLNSTLWTTLQLNSTKVIAGL